MGVTPESAAYFRNLNPNIFSGAERVAAEVETVAVQAEDPIMTFFRREIAEIQQRARERIVGIKYVETQPS